MTESAEAYNRREIAKIQRAFKAMSDEAQSEAKRIGYDLASFAQSKIRMAAFNDGKPAQRIAQGSKVSKSSKTGELSLGFARQKFSGGGTTQINWRDDGGSAKILAGWEFGSNRFNQFPNFAGTNPTGRGSKGRFIYPTLRAIQPSIVSAWEKSFNKVIEKWSLNVGNE